MRSYSQKLAWSDGSGSDCIALLNAYKTWKKCSDKGQFQDRKTEMQWCNRVLLEMSYLHEMRDLVNDISRRLVQFGLGETSRADRVVWNDKEKMNILKICLAGAFFPNIFTRQKDDHYEMMTYMEIGGHSPFNTVVFKNMENRTVGDLYGQQIKRALVKKEICDSTEKIKVFFDSNSTKVYVTFLDDKSLIERPLDCDTPGIAPGRVLPEIYKCVKHRKDVNHLPIKIMENTDAVKFAEEKGLGSVVDGIFKIKQNVMTHPHLCVVPSVVVRKMQGFVTHVRFVKLLIILY